MPARLTIPGAVLAVAALLKVFDTAVRWSVWIAVLWAAAAVLATLSDRWGGLAVAGLAWWSALFGLYGNHVVWLGWLGLIFAIFPEHAQRKLLVRTQLTVLYGFGALAKLHGDWLSGAVLEARGAAFPASSAIAWLTLLMEALLAAALWMPRWRRIWLPVAATMHIAFVVGIADGTPLRVGLVVFNFSVLAMLWWSTKPAAAGLRSAVPTPTT